MLINISKTILHIQCLNLSTLIKLHMDLMYAKCCFNQAVTLVTVNEMLPLPPVYANFNNLLYFWDCFKEEQNK